MFILEIASVCAVCLDAVLKLFVLMRLLRDALGLLPSCRLVFMDCFPLHWSL